MPRCPVMLYHLTQATISDLHFMPRFPTRSRPKFLYEFDETRNTYKGVQ